MKPTLLTLLAEPGTGAPLELSDAVFRGDDVWEGRLTSRATGKAYAVRNGIPRFVAPRGYTDSFGLQWTRFSRVQLDSANGGYYSRRRFDRETAWTGQDLAGRRVLDGGCGSGRFAEIAAQRGAEVVALDYSCAVDAAAANLADWPNVHCVQGDLLNPPFREASFDMVYSIGVIQHTPSPPDALASCLRLLRPKGRFAFTIYARRWYTKLYAKYLLRPITRRLSAPFLLRSIEAAMPVLFPVTGALFSLPLLGKGFQFILPVANYVHKKDFSRSQRYQEAILDTFDMLSPTFDRPMTAPEVARHLRNAGVSDFRFLEEVPIVVTGSVPDSPDVAAPALLAERAVGCTGTDAPGPGRLLSASGSGTAPPRSST
jgi:SAM-dependent methyltransferase